MIRSLSAILVCVTAAMGQNVPAPAVNAVARNTAGNTASPEPITPSNTKPETPAVDSSIPDIPPLPGGKASLLGGTIKTVDHLRNSLVLNMFGGGHISVLFDERTKVFAGPNADKLDDLKAGQRVYLDTTLDGSKLFARSVRVGMQLPTGQSSGQILDYDESTQQLTLRDPLSPKPFRMRVSSATTIMGGDGKSERVPLQPGMLVSLTFTPDPLGEMPKVQQIRVIASPGAKFVVAGQVEYLDLHRDLLVIKDPRDGKTFELRLGPSISQSARSLRPGQNATVEAVFDGKAYQANRIDAATQPNTTEQ